MCSYKSYLQLALGALLAMLQGLSQASAYVDVLDLPARVSALAVNSPLSDMARAGDLNAALGVADRAGIPAQNLLLADRHGRIAWRLAGARPDRSGTCTAGGIANTSDAPLATSLRSTKSGVDFTYTVTRNNARILSREPTASTISARQRIALMLAAACASLSVNSRPTRPGY